MTTNITRETINDYILQKIIIHPLTKFEEKEFLELLEYSLSLSVWEKKRVIDAIPTLSQKQIDELTTVFEDERKAFQDLMKTNEKEKETILELTKTKRAEWEELYDVYINEAEAKKQESKEQDELEAARKALEMSDDE